MTASQYTRRVNSTAKTWTTGRLTGEKTPETGTVPRLQLRYADEGEGGLQELQQLRRRQHIDARQQSPPRRAQDRLVRVRPAPRPRR